MNVKRSMHSALESIFNWVWTISWQFLDIWNFFYGFYWNFNKIFRYHFSLVFRHFWRIFCYFSATLAHSFLDFFSTSFNFVIIRFIPKEIQIKLKIADEVLKMFRLPFGNSKLVSIRSLFFVFILFSVFSFDLIRVLIKNVTFT